jgi:4-diphosphocytidyl-2-C-methyl-D-erythritol kinase
MSDNLSEITIRAYAKINLSIDVLGKRPDGYHEVLMVMQQVDLSDMVTVYWQPEGGGLEDQPIRISLTSNLQFLPLDNRNIAYKAAESMVRRYGGGRSGRIMIHIDKRIPVAAGLAGGSANCAAVLHAMNKLWELNLDLAALMKPGMELGADVPFCLAGQAALNEALELTMDPMAGTCAIASGIGEKLEKVTPLNSWVLLSKPSISLSTAQVYGGLKLQEITERPNTVELAEGLKEGNLYKISKNMTNVLENYSLKEYPTIVYTKNKIVQEGKAYKALMSGSGPTVFGLFTSKRKGTAAFMKLKALNKETFLVKTL